MKFSSPPVVTLAAAFFVFGMPGLAGAATTVNLGTADSFVVLAGSAVTNTGPSVIAGDVGLSPSAGTSYSGLTAGEVTGTIYAVDATGPAGVAGNNPGLLTSAKNDLVTAYTTAAAEVPVSTVPTELGGTLKLGGVYDSADGTFGITGTLTLDAQGDPDTVFIFKSASTLITASASHVFLINGAQACRVFWQVGSSATLGTGSDFKGNILALSSITDDGGSTVVGRLLARNAAVTLNNTHITKAACASPTASTVSGSLTGTVTAATGTVAAATSSPAGTVATSSTGTLTGTVATSSSTSTPALIAPPSLGGGGNGPPVATVTVTGSAGGGGSIVPGAISGMPEVTGEVLGISTDVPNVPNTGAGGGAPGTFLALLLSALLAFVAVIYLRYETG